MLLERVNFLENTMKTTFEEIMEEAELIMEGNDPKQCASTIMSIMKEMIRAMEETSYDDELCTEEALQKEEFNFKFPPVDPGLKTRFEIGQRVKIAGGFCPVPPHEFLFESSKIKNRERFGTKYERFSFKECLILFKFIHDSKNYYVVEHNEILFFAPERIFEKVID